MKKLLSILSLSLLATTAIAAPPTKEDCSAISQLAEVIMQSRQAGIDAEQMMKVGNSDPIATQLVIAAFKEPKFSTPDFQQEAISEFKSEVYLDCLSKSE